MITNTTISATRDVEIQAVYRAVRTFSATHPKGILNSRIITLRESGNARIHIGLALVGLGFRVTVSEGDQPIGDGHVEGYLGPYWSGHWVRLRVQAFGNIIRVKAWFDGLPEPEAWSLVTTTTVIEPGTIGLDNYGATRQVSEFGWVSISTGGAETRVPGNMLYKGNHVDYSNLKNLLVSVSTPLVPEVANDPRAHDPDAETYFFEDIAITPPEQRELRARALGVALETGNPNPPAQDGPGGYSHCSRFAGSFVISMIDPKFPGDLTNIQGEYLADPKNGWERIGDGTDRSVTKLGDVWVTRDPGHVFIYVGEYGGYPDVIADASYGGGGGENGTRGNSYIARLRRWYIRTDGRDLASRLYYGYRYVGRPDHQAPIIVDRAYEDRLRPVTTNFEFDVSNEVIPIWTEPTAWTITTDGITTEGSASNARGRSGAVIKKADGRYRNVEIVTLARYTGTGTGHRIGLFARGNGNESSSSHVYLTIQTTDEDGSPNGGLRINTRTDGNLGGDISYNTRTATNAEWRNKENTDYFLRLRVFEDQVQGKQWLKGTPEPEEWDLTIAHKAISKDFQYDGRYGKGWVGLYNTNSSTQNDVYRFASVAFDGATAPIPPEYL